MDMNEHLRNWHSTCKKEDLEKQNVDVTLVVDGKEIKFSADSKDIEINLK